jgi:hypothetical protein
VNERLMGIEKLRMRRMDLATLRGFLKRRRKQKGLMKRLGFGKHWLMMKVIERRKDLILQR